MGEGNGTPLHYSCHENPMSSKKRHKEMKPEDELSRMEGFQYATGEKHRAITNSFRKNEAARPKQKQCLAVDMSGGQSLML